MQNPSRVAGFMPLTAATGEAVALSMQELWLTGDILPVGARLVVRHRFRCSHDEPAEVIYAFVLPRDGALRRFRVEGDGFSVRSRLEPVAEAIETYEQGIEAGHLSTLARLYRDGVANLSLGNIRPGETVTVHLEIVAGVEVRDDGLRFRFPFTLAPAYHKNARVVAIEPASMDIELPEDQFGSVLLPPVREDAEGLHAVGFSLNVELACAIARVASPSHAINVDTDGPGRERCCVGLAVAADVPDRDLVLDMSTKDVGPVVLSGVDETGRGHFAVVVPSTFFGELTEAPRRLVFVLDRSGSMRGRPLAQAKKALRACLGALSAEDRFGLVSFSTGVDALSASLTLADQAGRSAAEGYIERIEAGGGTELLSALQEAAGLLGKDGGDLVVLTDGQVYGTEKVLAGARAAGARIQCLGIGSASQDRFLALLARETSGVCRFVTPRERVDMAALELFAAVGRPVASDLSAAIVDTRGGVLLPEPPRYVFSGWPLELWGEVDSAGDAAVALRWRTRGHWRDRSIPFTVTQSPAAASLALLRGARLITDLDSRIGDESPHGPAKRQRERLERRLQQLSNEYSLASRAMALVAIVEREGDRPGSVPTTSVVPLGMPQDTAFGAYVAMTKSRGLGAGIAASSASDAVIGTLSSGAVLRQASYGSDVPAFRRARRPLRPATEETHDASTEPSEPQDHLVDMAGDIQPDGGMPGQTDDERTARTALAIVCFVANGSSAGRGPFGPHVRRLAQFLLAVDLSRLSEGQRGLIEAVLELAHAGRPLERARDDDARWLAAGIRHAPDDFTADAVWRRVGAVV